MTETLYPKGPDCLFVTKGEVAILFKVANDFLLIQIK